MNKATALMPLPRHDRSQMLGVTVVDDAVVVDALMMISSRTEGEGAETLCLGPDRLSDLSIGLMTIRQRHRISSIRCTAPSGRASPTPTVTMRFKKAYGSAEVSNRGSVRK